MDQDVDQGSTLDTPDVNDDQSQNSQSLNSQEGSTTKVKKRTKKNRQEYGIGGNQNMASS